MERMPSVIHDSWHPYLIDVFQDNDMKYLNHFVLPNCQFAPEPQNIFRVFSMPLTDIKVVIIGQDPYSKVGQAIGYAFAVPDNVPKPFSFRMIEKEVGHELENSLASWISQGVFLFNTSLTVEVGKPNSHKAYWRSFSMDVIRILSSKVNPVWMLWGLDAISLERNIKVFQLGNKYILKSPHPAAESYANYKAGFLGNKHFILANELLKSQNKPLINW